ncbi:Uncharacterised protein [Mycobacterium tuberculosis]|uniref:Uncharacterized protein n=1 Tax=Mycobacterium tuberculosis TaxID=1773 RepID=A0A916LFS1_MYCTX|nr:Uncharacterised protein [Mycobacterium tuberculosis]CKT33219.1 Uncharacterised protein [Mycobacterium tuberculosis]CKU99969.1 Uncharacterised protein [Mycobacterium tuberculosis]COX19531.1 Uncharacterised protein [Mycobacterium tuberculosis]COX48085.1 Uncharacterised protein [Mycobacterium tuberculosis]
MKDSSAVSWASNPILSSWRPRSNPAMPRSTTNKLNPCAPFSGSVCATTITRSELIPLVMNVFDPFST